MPARAHQLAVRVDDVPALMHDEDRARGGDAVEIPGVHPASVEEQRVETPRQQRLVGVGQRALGLLHPADDLVDGRKPGVDHAVGRHPIVEADVDLVPSAAFATVAVAFDQAGHDDLVREAVVDLVRSPARELFERSGAEDPAVANRDVARNGTADVHGDDLAGGVDGEHGQQVSGSGTGYGVGVRGWGVGLGSGVRGQSSQFGSGSEFGVRVRSPEVEVSAMTFSRGGRSPRRSARRRDGKRRDALRHGRRAEASRCGSDRPRWGSAKRSGTRSADRSGSADRR